MGTDSYVRPNEANKMRNKSMGWCKEDCGALVMKLRLSCTNPSKYSTIIRWEMRGAITFSPFQYKTDVIRVLGPLQYSTTRKSVQQHVQAKKQRNYQMTYYLQYFSSDITTLLFSSVLYHWFYHLYLYIIYDKLTSLTQNSLRFNDVNWHIEAANSCLTFYRFEALNHPIW